MEKCGLIEKAEGEFVDNISAEAYIWYDENWQHDAYEHSHQRYQLTYVTEGYQYFHIGQKIYLVPQNHVIWIPSMQLHRASSEAELVNLMVLLFKTTPKLDFYNQVHVFPAPPVLKEMILYASKWNKNTSLEKEQQAFLSAMLISLPHFCNDSNCLEIPIPKDDRLLSVCHFINKNYSYQLDIDELASIAHVSVRTLQRIFKQETGISVQKYVQLVRILKSIELMETKRYTLSEVAFKVGYKSLSAFSTSYFSIMKTKLKVKK